MKSCVLAPTQIISKDINTTGLKLKRLEQDIKNLVSQLLYFFFFYYVSSSSRQFEIADVCKGLPSKRKCQDEKI